MPGNLCWKQLKRARHDRAVRGWLISDQIQGQPIDLDINTCPYGSKVTKQHSCMTTMMRSPCSEV